jgi:DNA polymerase-3 subunit epsilon
VKLNLKNPLVFFDLESTGIDTVNDRIVEYSFIKMMPNGDEIVETKKINPTIPIPAEVTLIHGIADEDVKDAPTFKDVAKNLAKFLEGADLAGFNLVRFDVPMLVEEFLRAGISFNLKNRKILDAQRIFHMMEPRNLTAAYKFYCDKDLKNAHSAEADTRATLDVFVSQVAHYQGVKRLDKDGNEYEPIQNDMAVLHKLTQSNKVDLAGRMVYNNDNIAVFNFGKNRNRSVLEVLKKEPQYYDWIMRSGFPQETKQKLTEIKLSQFNNK